MATKVYYWRSANSPSQSKILKASGMASMAVSSFIGIQDSATTMAAISTHLTYAPLSPFSPPYLPLAHTLSLFGSKIQMAIVIKQISLIFPINEQVEWYSVVLSCYLAYYYNGVRLLLRSLSFPCPSPLRCRAPY